MMSISPQGSISPFTQNLGALDRNGGFDCRGQGYLGKLVRCCIHA